MSKKIVSYMWCALILLACPAVFAQESQETANVSLAGGKLDLPIPQDWKQVEPKSRIVQYEFSAPKDAKSEAETARITIMQAGGSIEANIERWYMQFEQPDGSATKTKSKTEKFEVDGQTVHFVDIPGTFKDSMGGGPFSGGKVVKRENYRMLGAIIETKELGQHFIKVTGPTDVVEKLTKDFKESLKNLDAK